VKLLLQIKEIIETVYFGFKEIFEELARSREMPRTYHRCIWKDTEDGELQLLCLFPVPPWWSKKPTLQAELQKAFDDFYAKNPDYREYAPKPPGWWKTNRRAPRQWNIWQRRRAERLYRAHSRGWWKAWQTAHPTHTDQQSDLGGLFFSRTANQ
jgi:hypothetical protein